MSFRISFIISIIMYYQLNSNIALRSWWLVPSAILMKEYPYASGISQEELALLEQCDSHHDIEDSDVLKALAEKHMIHQVEKDAGGLTSWQKYRAADNRYFPKMNWMITSRCNYNCLHCFNAADNSPLQDDWTMEEADALLDEAQKCGIYAFTLTGGEPMIHRDFLSIVKGIYQRDMYVEELNTNGSMINQAILDEMKSIGCHPLMKISFDGLRHHDWLRNHPGAEEDALRAIRLCISNGFRVKVQTNVNRTNLDTLLETAEYMDRIGVGEMRIIRTSESPRWIRNAGNTCLTFQEYFDEMNDFTQKYIENEHHMIIDEWQYLEFDPARHSYRCKIISCREGDYRDSLPVCKGNRGMVAVAADGELYPCLQISGCYLSHGWHLGNVKKDGLQPLLQSGDYLNAVCTTLADLKEKNEKCAKCRYFRYCAGGCRTIAAILTDSIFGEDPSKCEFFNNNYYEKIQKIFDGWTNEAPMSL